MKVKMMLLTLLVATYPAFANAISIGSISDAISSRTPTTTQIPTPSESTKKASGLEDDNNTVADENHSAQTISHSTTSSPALPNPALFIEDAAMTGYIRSQLLFKKMPSVNVTTENAVVSLSGTVETQEQANTLIKIASSVKGVKFVNTDHLKVKA